MAAWWQFLVSGFRHVSGQLTGDVRGNHERKTSLLNVTRLAASNSLLPFYVVPPHTLIAWPVTNELASEARNATMAATSSGRP